MWLKPEEIKLSDSWTTEQANPFFVLQQRRGHEERRSSLASFFVTTIGSVLDNKNNAYRILHRRSDTEIYYLIALADKREKINENWKWIEENIMPTLGGIDVSDDITDFVLWKIKSMCAQVDDEEIEDFESEKFKNATKKFHQIFNMPTEEKLVIFYPCSIWRRHVPRQGILYLSINYLCFFF
jgi:succinate dehydrogenase flavin-adding protein (antitoxin of CptAB toxin-antitoxin module)